MALVDYISSEDEREDDSPPEIDSATRATNLKRKREGETSSSLPPLPSKFFDLYASTTRVSTRDEPSFHGGRKRVIPHIDGNWPTHVYIEWCPSTAEHESLTKLISKIDAEVAEVDGTIQSLLTSDLGVPLPLHISLSRPIGFPTEQKDGFVTSLEHLVNSSGVRPFNITLSGYDWVPNFENTRWFLVLRLQRLEGNGLNKLLHITNNVVEEFGEQPLYAKESKTAQDNTLSKSLAGSKTKSLRGRNSTAFKSKIGQKKMEDFADAFHISIAWTLRLPSRQLLEFTKSSMADRLDEIKDIQIKIEDVKAKLGNVVTNIHLPKNVVERKGLFGF